MKKIIILIVLIAAGCSKMQLKEPTCHFACLISDKYNPDSTFILSDTLWGKGGMEYACGKDIDSCRAQGDRWIVDCNTSTIEHWYYIFDRNIVKPIILK